MYKPPENSNRVHSIKSKFEQIEASTSPPTRNTPNNGTTTNPDTYKTDPLTKSNYFNQKHNLARQLSDPSKRNIKRTPAFRLDRPLIEKSAFTRDTPCNRSYFESKVRQFNTARPKIDCDNERKPDGRPHVGVKPLLVKSKSSHDFASIRNRFDSNRKENAILSRDLYTEPIPKTQRAEKAPKLPPSPVKIDSDNRQLTDTLKMALKRPLPAGPAPRKPPRTFEHTPAKEPVKNVSFLHLEKEEVRNSTVKSGTKRDPRYMLNKLELALRSNKIRRRRVETTTSGEDSDDSLLFRSKTKRKLGLDSSGELAALSFNCLNGCGSDYERIEAPKSKFFVDEEPVYAEPWHFDASEENERLGRKRNSLYYMSTALLDNSDKMQSLTIDNSPSKQDSILGVFTVKNQKMAQKQISAENSSLSSFTSDLDSAGSTPIDDGQTIEQSLKMKQLISAFEATSSNEPSPKVERHLNPTILTNSPQRIEELKMNLQRTLDRCFNTSTIESFANERNADLGTDSGNFDEIIDKFQTYIKTMPKYEKLKVNKSERLFDCCLIVGWSNELPEIKFKFPKNFKVPNQIEALCFPEAASGPLDQSNNAQCYSLVITNDRGERIFGYCRRVIPEGSTSCIPIAYCVLSRHRAPRLYHKILEEFESRHGAPSRLRDQFIDEFYFNKFPRPGESVHVNLSGMMDEAIEFDGGKKSRIEVNGGRIELAFHQDVRYEEADLKPLHALPHDVLLKIFASLLLERKVILISCVISKLSSCVDALQSILYPFSWPHTFIPILPQCLWEVVEAPTPVICGILSVDIVNKHQIENGIVVDLDEESILCSEGDENNIISGTMRKAWLQGIELAKSMSKHDYPYSVQLYDAYIRVFSVSLKHYKTHIVNGVFERDNFVKNGKTKGIRRFLKWFTETNLFTTFIETAIASPDSFNLFDRKIDLYASEQSNEFLTKLFDWNKTKG